MKILKAPEHMNIGSTNDSFLNYDADHINNYFINNMPNLRANPKLINFYRKNVLVNMFSEFKAVSASEIENIV